VSKSRKHGSIHPLPHTPSWRSAYLVKYRDNFTSYRCYNSMGKKEINFLYELQMQGKKPKEEFLD
jgi:hypothetical protein